MRKKVFFFLFFPLLMELVVSCCDCPEQVILHYTNKGALVKNLDNSGSGPVVTTAGPVPKAAYGIRIELLREKTAVIRKPVFLPAAYAFDCACGPALELQAKDSITAITIVTLNDFDPTHRAGSDVSAFFKGYKPYYFLSIPDYLAKWDTRLYYESELATEVNLLLMTAPAFDGRHQFLVRISLSDGRIIEHNTPPIELR